MLRERITPALDAPEARSLEESILIKVERLIAAFDGFFGKVIAEGQSKPAVLRELNNGYINLRRADTVADVRRAQAAGEFPADLDGELLVDAIFGAIYYQLLLKQRPLTRDYGRALVTAMFRSAKRR